MQALLKEKGYKITPARTAIMNIFVKSRVPLTAEDVYQGLKKDKNSKDTNEATVYRTLTSFAKDGILKRIDWGKDSAYFELAREHHHHITCVKCETVEDFENEELEKNLGGIIRKSSKFTNVRDHSLELFGLCKNCS
jgi:Fur family ferric uptake transcriptional regulator